MSVEKPDRKKKYEDKRVKITVSFNAETEAHLIKLAKSKNFSQWVKQKLEEEALI